MHFVRDARQIMGKDTIVITVDFKNAYNTRRRVDMWNTLLQYSGVNGQRAVDDVDLSKMLNLFHWAYAVPSPLVLPVSSESATKCLTVLPSDEGVRQGDPLSSLVFSLSMQGTYKNAMLGIDPAKAQALAIQDDFTIVGSPLEALIVFENVVKEAQKIGMEVQRGKCKWLPPMGHLLRDDVDGNVSDDLRTVSEALANRGVSQVTRLDLLGAVLSVDEADMRENVPSGALASGSGVRLIEEFLLSTMNSDRHMKFFELLTHREMPAQIAFKLLYLSGIPRLNYWARIFPPHVLRDTAERFDPLVRDTLLKLLNTNETNLIMTYDDKAYSIIDQLYLKRSAGGLGLTRHAENSAIAYLSSLCSSLSANKSLYECLSAESVSLFSSLKHQRIQLCLDAMKKNDVLSTTVAAMRPEEVVARFATRAEDAAKMQSKLTAAHCEQRREKLAAAVSRGQAAALLSGAQPYASSWLTVTPSTFPLRLSDSEFSAAVRHRLGMRFDAKNRTCYCACNEEKRVDVSEDPNHFFVCKNLKKNSIYRRHQLVLNTLIDLCREAGVNTKIPGAYDYKYGGASPLNLAHGGVATDNREESEWSGSESSPERERFLVPDLEIYPPSSISPKPFMVDVSVGLPSARTYVDKHHADSNPGATAELMAKQKTRKYERIAERNDYKFVPFCLESYGTLSESAMELLKTISKNIPYGQHHFLSYAYNRIAVALQRGNALIVNEGLFRMNERMDANERKISQRFTTPPFVDNAHYAIGINHSHNASNNHRSTLVPSTHSFAPFASIQSFLSFSNMPEVERKVGDNGSPSSIFNGNNYNNACDESKSVDTGRVVASNGSIVRASLQANNSISYPLLINTNVRVASTNVQCSKALNDNDDEDVKVIARVPLIYGKLSDSMPGRPAQVDDELPARVRAQESKCDEALNSIQSSLDEYNAAVVMVNARTNSSSDYPSSRSFLSRHENSENSCPMCALIPCACQHTKTIAATIAINNSSSSSSSSSVSCASSSPRMAINED